MRYFLSDIRRETSSNGDKPRRNRVTSVSAFGFSTEYSNIVKVKSGNRPFLLRNEEKNSSKVWHELKSVTPARLMLLRSHRRVKRSQLPVVSEPRRQNQTRFCFTDSRRLTGVICKFSQIPSQMSKFDAKWPEAKTTRADLRPPGSDGRDGRRVGRNPAPFVEVYTLWVPTINRK